MKTSYTFSLLVGGESVAVLQIEVIPMRCSVQHQLFTDSTCS